MLEDPYPFYAGLQQRHAVLWSEGMQSWLVTRYAECRDVLNDHERFTQDRKQIGGTASEARQNLQASALSDGLDPAGEKALRRLIVNSIHSQDIDQLAGSIRADVDRLFAALASRPVFDWMTEVAAPLAAAITAELLGLREPEPGTFKRVSEAIAQGYNADVKPENSKVGQDGRAQLGALIEDAWGAAADRGGAVAVLKNSADTNEFSTNRMKENLGLLFNGSFAAIFAACGNVALTLLRRPDVLDRLRDPALLDTGIDELIRYDGPAQVTSRVATQDTKIRDVAIRAGDGVIALLAAANRDPEEFPEPNELVLDRKPNRHLGFGWGMHGCVGQAFGRAALRGLVTGLHEAPTPLRLAGTPVRLRATSVRSLDSLPVTFAE
ncbi:cytochrome P450 [Plantactinospora siamensis]